MPKPTITSHALFFEDIREEVGNKFTYVGSLGHVVQMPQFPITMPRLGIAIFTQFPDDHRKPVTFQVTYTMRGGETRTLMENEIEVPVDLPTAPELSEIEEPMKILATAHVLFSPLNLEGAGRLRVLVKSGKETIRAGAIIFAERPLQPE